MDSFQFIRALQVSDSFFPVGAFAYSDGLETAAASGRVSDAVSLKEWMNHFLDAVFVPCEGLALVKCMFALSTGDMAAFIRLDEELTAIRPALCVRAASTGIGKRLLSSFATMREGDGGMPVTDGNAAAAYARVFFHWGINERHAALAYGY